MGSSKEPVEGLWDCGATSGITGTGGIVWERRCGQRIGGLPALGKRKQVVRHVAVRGRLQILVP